MFRHIEKSQTLFLNELSCSLEKDGHRVIKFGFGQSPFLPPKHVIDALKDAAHRKEYMPTQGLFALREAVAKFYYDTEGLEVNAENVFIAPGSKILIYAIMAVFEKANVFIPAPSWVSYEPQAKLLRHNACFIPTSYEGRWRLTPQALEGVIKENHSTGIPNILIFNYPGNPDGLTYSATELQKLAEVLRRYDVLVISDEIYGLLHHSGEHVSLAKFYPEKTIVTGGLSKWCGAGGWRLGTAVIPAELPSEFRKALLGVASETYSCASAPIQVAACHAYQFNQTVKGYLAAQRKILSFLGNWVAEELQAAGVHVHLPQGGFYLFLDFSPFAESLSKHGITTAKDLCEKLLADTGVVILPGDAFGMPVEHLSARLAYVDFNGEKALELANSVEYIPLSALDDEFSLIKEGAEKIAKWLKAEAS